MLRSATKIKLNAKSLQNYDGLLIAPEIDFFGLVLKADPQQPLDPRIIEFFTLKNTKIGRIKIFGDFFIKITGEFNLTKPEIDAFLLLHPDINIASLANTLSGKPSSKMKQILKQLSAYSYAYANKNKTLFFTNGQTIHSIREGLLNSETDTSITSAYSDVKIRTGLNISGENTDYQAGRDVCLNGWEINFETHSRINATIDGYSQQLSYSTGVSDVSSIEVGWLGVTFAGNNINVNAKRSQIVQNYVLNAINIITLDAGINGNIRIEIDKSREWMNNPYPELFTQYIKHKLGAIRMISESEFDEMTTYDGINDLIEDLNMSSYIDLIQTPKELECPISNCLMRDPVILGNTGRVFDKAAIKQALKVNPNINPLTNDRLENSNLLTNYSMRNMIEDFIRNDARELIDDYIRKNKETTAMRLVNNS